MRHPFFAAVLCAGCLALPAHAPAAMRLDMEGAVMHALQSNPAVESAEHSVRAAISGRNAARASFGPTVGVTYGYDRYNKDRASRSERNATSVTVRLSQPIFTGFQLLNASQKAVLQEEYQRLQLDARRLSIALQTQQAFLSYLKEVESIRSGRRALERAKSQLALSREAWQLGIKPRLDMLQAEVEVARAETSLITHENGRDVWRARLNSLLGIPQAQRVEYQGNLNLHPFGRTLEQCLACALERRPDLLMARKSVEIAARDLGIAQSAFWPQVSAVLGWTSSGSHIGADGGKYSRKDYSYANIGLTLSWTLFSSGKRLHLTRQAKHEVKALEAAVRDAVNNSAYDVRACLLSAQDAYRMVKVAQKAVASARESYNDAKMRYELQSGTYLELLTAQSSLSDAELSEISARADCLGAIARLYEAMGEIHPGLEEGKRLPLHEEARAVPGKAAK